MPTLELLPYGTFVFLDHFPFFSDLSQYLDLYWSLTFISDTDSTMPSYDSISGTYVRHSQGQLHSIYYRGHFGAPSFQEGHRIQQLIKLLDCCGFQIASEDDSYAPPIDNVSNWSTTDIDALYHLCSVCELATVDDTEICKTCAYVQSFLDNS